MMRPACGFANCRSRRSAFCGDCAAKHQRRRKPCRRPQPAAAIRQMAKSVRRTARRAGDRRGAVCGRGRHRRRRAAVARDRADRAAGCVGLFGRDHRARPATRRARRLRGLPHQHQRRRSMPAAGRSKRRSASSTAPTSRPMSKPASARGPIPPSSARCARASIATAGISIRRFPTRISPRRPMPTCRRSTPT